MDKEGYVSLADKFASLEALDLSGSANLDVSSMTYIVQKLTNLKELYLGVGLDLRKVSVFCYKLDNPNVYIPNLVTVCIHPF